MNSHNPSPLPIVVLVDDKDTDLELNELSIQRSGLPVRCEPFRSSMEALDYLHMARITGAPPALMILDLKMPEMNGVELLDFIHANRLKDFPVVVLSGSGMYDDVQRSQQLGIEGCYEKPIDLEDSCRLFRFLLEKHVFAAAKAEPSLQGGAIS